MRSPRFAQLAQNQKAMRIRDRSGMDALRAVIESYDTDFVLQEAIPGPESLIESHHVYVDAQGEVAGEFTGRKIRTYPRTTATAPRSRSPPQPTSRRWAARCWSGWASAESRRSTSSATPTTAR